MREIMDLKNSEYRHFLRGEDLRHHYAVCVLIIREWFVS